MNREPDFTSDKPSPSVINLTLPIWAVWPILVVFMSATVYFVNTLNSINTKLDKASDDRWKLSFQRQFANELRYINNGSIKVPDADEIAHRLSQP